jgi:hypothetical protein
MLEPHLQPLSDEIIAAIRERVPAYRRPLRGRFGAGIRRGVEEALGQFVDLIADPELDRSGARSVYRGLGRGEYRDRRSLDALLSAYRIGARVSWRRISELAIEARVDRATLALLAESVFAYIDEISGLSIEGYAAEQSAEAGETQRRRRRLALLLLDPEPDPDAVAEAAAAAGWDPPATVAAVCWPAAGAATRRALPLDALVVADEDGAGTALVPDAAAPGLAARLDRAAGDSVAVLGPEVPPARALASATRAEALLELIESGAVQGAGLVRADDHLATLVTHSQPAVLAELAAARLTPLDDETPASRARLTETLREWLAHHGDVAAVARHMHVHPQTVRYRLKRLRERFGADLDDPDARFELELALRGGGLPVASSGKIRGAEKEV